MRATAIGVNSGLVESSLKSFTGKKILGFGVTRLFEPDTVILALLFVSPANSGAGLDGDFLRDELKFEDFNLTRRIASGDHGMGYT